MTTLSSYHVFYISALALCATLLGCSSNPGGETASPDAGGSPAGDAQPPTMRCGRTKAAPGDGDAFARAKYGMAATWRGTATSPWVKPYTVEITFAADGSYDAHTVDHSGVDYAVPPFYYDRDPEHDRYELVDLHANGDVSGNIYLEWLTSPDAINAIRFNDVLTHLHFEYFHFGYGPIVYELDCSP